jgi:hypothetical protein
MQTEIAQLNLERAIREADSAQVGNAVHSPMNAKSVQMGVAPAHHRPESGVKLGYRGIASDQKTPLDPGG